MTRIIQTPQQRANTIEALNVMWPSVPPENVISNLCVWRDAASLRAGMHCGSLGCFGGWCAVYPAFAEQGIEVDGFGMPYIDGYGGTYAAEPLFGWAGLFQIRGLCDVDDHFVGTDHELVTHRLQWLLDNSEVRP